MPDKITFKFKSPEESPGYLLGQLHLLWQRRQKKILDPLDLTSTQFILLAALGWLSRTKDHVTQTEIADLGNSDRMMVSKVLRTLEEKKFITRKEHALDPRAKSVKLTAAGARLLQVALERVEEMDIAFFSVLGARQASFNSHILKVIQGNEEP